MLVLLVGGCGSDTSRKPTSVEDKVRVSGEFGKEPKITIAKPLKVPTSTSWTLIKGDRDTVRPDSTAILHLTLADARTGKTVISTLQGGQPPLEASMTDQLFPSLVKALTGAKAGSRVVIASTAKDSYGTQGNTQLGIKAGDPVVMVADVLSDRPQHAAAEEDRRERPGTGAPRTFIRQMPTVREGRDGPTGFVSFGAHKPTKVQAYILREGTGPPLTEPRPDRRRLPRSGCGGRRCPSTAPTPRSPHVSRSGPWPAPEGQE